MNHQLPNFSVDLVTAKTVQSISLLDWINQQNTGLILYFYPKDNTSACSLQATDFSQLQSQFLQLGYQIIGVSKDSVASHQKFIVNQQLTIPLISDVEQTLCQYFGVIGEKKLYGKTYLGIVRSTLIFDHQGKIKHEFRNVKAKEHAEHILAVLQSDLA